MDRTTGQEMKFLRAFVGASRRDAVIREKLEEFITVNDTVTIWAV
jgi:hypothetical protein